MSDNQLMDECIRRLKDVEQSRIDLHNVLEKHNITFETNPRFILDFVTASEKMWRAANQRLPGEEVWPRKEWPTQ